VTVDGRMRYWMALWLACVLSFALAGPSAAEIYQWKDASGRVHFTQDLSQVPPAERGMAEARAAQKPKASRVQVYQPPASVVRNASALGASRATGGKAGKVYKIRVRKAGNAMKVMVRINGQLDVPFHIDTGASDVVLPSWAAEKLNLDLSDARTGVYGTANGVVRQKLVQLRSVSVNGAEVQGVPATISPSMRFGLLGLSYFNHFKYDIDPVAGLVTLRRNDLAERGVLKGGRSEGQWRSQFAAATRRIKSMEAERDAVPFGRSRARKARDAEVAGLNVDLKRLHREADNAQVPFAWRN
jgi:clan AA aspartic protease (TIGR02281 family)